MSKVYPEPNTGCWLWGGPVNDDGYGLFRYSVFPFKLKTAHRASYWMYNGEFDHSKLNVLHVCDNPCCVNPDHLFLGTHKDNMKDKALKNRHGRKAPIGEYAHSAKITEAQVIEIRSLCGFKKQSEIAKMYNITQSNVSAIINRKNWKHIC